MISYKSGSAITAIAYGKIFAFTFVHAWLSLAFVDVYKKKSRQKHYLICHHFIRSFGLYVL